MHRTLLLAAIFLVGACAAQAATAPEGRDCFRNRDVNSWSVVDDHTVRVHVSNTREYDLHTINGFVRDLRFSLGMALHSGSSWICTGPGGDTEIRRGRESWGVAQITRAPPPAPQGS